MKYIEYVQEAIMFIVIWGFKGPKFLNFDPQNSK